MTLSKEGGPSSSATDKYRKYHKYHKHRAERAPELGRGRRAMKEMMKSSDETYSLEHHHSSTLHNNNKATKLDGEGCQDTDKINFVRMLLAVKMTKTDGEAAPLEGTNNRVFLGSIGAAYNRDTLVSNKITHILCLCEGVREKYDHDFKYFMCPMQDVPSCDIAVKFIPCSDFIEDSINAGGRVLVHCFAGKSRCCAITMSYLMLRRGMSFDGALECCRKARPSVEPNLGFVAQLRALDRSLRRSRFTQNKKLERSESAQSADGKAGKRSSISSFAAPTREVSALSVRTSLSPPSGLDAEVYNINKATSSTEENEANGGVSGQHEASALPPQPPTAADESNARDEGKTNNVGQASGGEKSKRDKIQHPEHLHVAAAASMTPKPSADEPNIRKRFTSASRLTLSFDESGSLVVHEKKLSNGERQKLHQKNKAIASRACSRLYSRAIAQKERADSKKEILPEEYTFSPSINDMSKQHAFVARARGKISGAADGFMAETEAFKVLKRQEINKLASLNKRQARISSNNSSERFNGFGSIFYDSEPVSCTLPAPLPLVFASSRSC